jgi:hypothetical protein
VPVQSLFLLRKGESREIRWEFSTSQAQSHAQIWPEIGHRQAVMRTALAKCYPALEDRPDLVEYRAQLILKIRMDIRCNAEGVT